MLIIARSSTCINDNKLKIDHHKLWPHFSARPSVHHQYVPLPFHDLCCIFSSNNICTHQFHAYETASGDFTLERCSVTKVNHSSSIGLPSSFYFVPCEHVLGASAQNRNGCTSRDRYIHYHYFTTHTWIPGY